MVLRTEHIRGSLGFIRATDVYIPLTGFSAVIIQEKVGEKYPRRIKVDELYEDLAFAQDRVTKLMEYEATSLVPLSSFTGKIYWGRICQAAPGVLAIHPDTIKWAWESRQGPKTDTVTWEIAPYEKPAVPSPSWLSEREASRHRRS